MGRAACMSPSITKLNGIYIEYVYLTNTTSISLYFTYMCPSHIIVILVFILSDFVITHKPNINFHLKH